MQSPWSWLVAPLLLAATLLSSQQAPPDAQDGAAPPQDAPSPRAGRERNWEEILGPAQGTWPQPRPVVRWFEDLDAAVGIAARESRPLFVVMRCLPCKQCAEFDAAVLEGGPALEPLLRQFVTVRLTNVQNVDLRRFPMQGMQDLDLSWWGWFLSPEGMIYGSFGGKDETGDKGRVSVPALAATLKRVLDHHHDRRRADWGVDARPERGATPVTPFDLPGFPSWARKFGGLNADGCLHCHQVAEILRQPALDAKTFDKQNDLQIWPYPENLGLVVARDDGLLVESVKPGSPAATAGIQAGDRLAAAFTRKLFSQTDLRSALQRVSPDGGRVELRWWREQTLMHAVFEVPAGWKRVVVDWRKSVADGNLGAHPGIAWPHPAKEIERKALRIPAKSMAIKPFFGKENAWTARRAGLLPGDVILSVNGESPNLSGREFMAWFRLKFEPGDKIVLRVVDSKGREREIVYDATARGR